MTEAALETVFRSAPDVASLGAARRALGLTVVLDQLIVSTLIVVPVSYVVWINSSEFGGARLVMAALFGLPFALIVLRWAGTRRLAKSRFDPVVITIYFGVIGIGLTNALLRSDYPWNVLSVYGQRLYWIGLAAVFLKLTASRRRTYVLTLVRRHYLIVAAAGWLFGLLWLTVGSSSLPHTEVTGAGMSGPATLLAYNYYLSLVYSFDGAVAGIPRFTFLYREPRMLAMGMAVGLMLQAIYFGVSVRLRRRKETLRALIGLVLIGGAFVLVGSLYGFLVAVALFTDLVALRIWPRAFWRRFRTIHFAIIVLGLLCLAFLYLALGARTSWNSWLSGNQDVVTQTAQSLGKPAGIVESYLRQRVTAPGALLEFPLGTGTMNLDNPRFVEKYGVATNGAETIIQVFLEEAGLVGLLAFPFVLWRILKVVGRQRFIAGEPQVRNAALLIAALLVVSTFVVDLILPSAQGILLLGLLIQQRPQPLRGSLRAA